MVPTNLSKQQVVSLHLLFRWKVDTTNLKMCKTSPISSYLMCMISKNLMYNTSHNLNKQTEYRLGQSKWIGKVVVTMGALFEIYLGGQVRKPYHNDFQMVSVKE